MNAQASSLAVQQRRRFRQGHLWLIPGLAVGVYASTLAGHLGLGLVPLLVFGIVPHLSVLLGLGQPHARGRLAPRAVPIFNAMHHPALPLVTVGIAAAGVLSPFWLVGGLAWLAHIVVDWGFGDGLRSADGFLLGWIGRTTGINSSHAPSGGASNG
jgi:hypothetical protein